MSSTWKFRQTHRVGKIAASHIAGKAADQPGKRVVYLLCNTKLSAGAAGLGMGRNRNYLLASARRHASAHSNRCPSRSETCHRIARQAGG